MATTTQGKGEIQVPKTKEKHSHREADLRKEESMGEADGRGGSQGGVQRGGREQTAISTATAVRTVARTCQPAESCGLKAKRCAKASRHLTWPGVAPAALEV